VKEDAPLWTFCFRRGRTSSLWEAILRRGSYYKFKGKVKGARKGKVKAKAKKGQRQAKEERHTKAKGALLQEASREVFKEDQDIREGLLLHETGKRLEVSETGTAGNATL
jgi:hypothetical protein